MYFLPLVSHQGHIRILIFQHSPGYVYEVFCLRLGTLWQNIYCITIIESAVFGIDYLKPFILNQKMSPPVALVLISMPDYYLALRQTNLPHRELQMRKNTPKLFVNLFSINCMIELSHPSGDNYYYIINHMVLPIAVVLDNNP